MAETNKVPKGFDLNKHYNPVKTDKEKEELSVKAKQTYAKEGTEWFDKMLERNRNKDEVWRANISKTITEKQNQTEYLEHMSKQRLEALDKVIPGENMTLRKKITLANRESAKNPIHHANRTKANRETRNKQYWKDAHAKGVLTYSESVMTVDGEYPSMAKWIKETNNPGGRSFLQSLPHLFYKIEDGPGEPTYERIYHTPYGKCAGDKFAYKLCKSKGEPNAVKLRNITGWWYKMAALYPKDYYITFEEAKYWPNECEKPFGIDELTSKPRIKPENLKSTIETWNTRLTKHMKMYKETKK